MFLKKWSYWLKSFRKGHPEVFYTKGINRKIRKFKFSLRFANLSKRRLWQREYIQVGGRGWGGGNGTVWAENIVPIKAVETHSFSLLRHNFFAIKTNKFQQPFYRCKLILLPTSPSPRSPLYTTPVAFKYHILLNLEKWQKNHKLSRNSFINQKIKNCPNALNLKNVQKSQAVPKSQY